MKYLLKVKDLLKGKKTYIVALAVGVLTVLKYLEVLPNDAYVTLMGLLGASGLATLRASK